MYTEDGGIGSGKTTRRFRKVDGLLGFGARLTGAVPTVLFSDGTEMMADAPATAERLSAEIGRRVALRRESAVAHHDESRLGAGMPRCVMVDLPQRGLDRHGRVLRSLRERSLTFGLQAWVARGGTVSVGDDAFLY